MTNQTTSNNVFELLSLPGTPSDKSHQDLMATFNQRNQAAINLYNQSGIREWRPDAEATGLLKGSGSISLHRTHGTINLSLSDSHGATARGTLTTTTVVRNNAAAVSGADVFKKSAEVVGRALENSSNKVGAALADGRYNDAAGHFGNALADAAIDALDWTHIGRGLNGIIDAYQRRMAEKGAAAQNAYDQWRQGIHGQVIDWGREQYCRQMTGHYLDEAWVFHPLPELYVAYPAGGHLWYKDKGENNTAVNMQLPATVLIYESANKIIGEIPVPLPPGAVEGRSSISGWGNPMLLTKEFYEQNRSKFPSPPPVLPTSAADFALDDPELVDLISQLLADTNKNHSELLNALAALGRLTADNTTTVINNNGVTNNTFVTPAYTPAGQTVPVQTQFVVSPSGGVSMNQIERPDLPPNSDEAPGREPTGQGGCHGCTSKPGDTDIPAVSHCCPLLAEILSRLDK